MQEQTDPINTQSNNRSKSQKSRTTLRKVTFCKGSALMILDKSWHEILGIKKECWAQQELTDKGLLVRFYHFKNGALVESKPERTKEQQ